MKIPSLFIYKANMQDVFLLYFAKSPLLFANLMTSHFLIDIMSLYMRKGLYDKGEPKEKEQRCNGAIFLQKIMGPELSKPISIICI